MTLTLRRDQLEAFAERMRRDIEDRIAAHLLEGIWREADETAVRAFVAAGVRKAEAYRITSEAHVTRFVLLMAAHGSEFDLQPWAAQLLQSSFHNPDIVMDALEYRARKERA